MPARSRAPFWLGCAAAAATLIAAEHRRVVRAREAAASRPKRRVVIVGAGFGGLQAAQGLAGQPGIDLTVIDAQNHHLFQPLLYQVATAALSPADIASPVRGILPENADTRVIMAAVDKVDTAARTVTCGSESYPYDDLIVATGSQSSYFGHGAWEKEAPSLKTLADALELRRRILLAFEHALQETDPVERARLLTFVLIGGGPTGVEMAGSIAELARDILGHAGQGDTARIILVEGGDRILAAFAPGLSANAAQALQGLGVTLQLGEEVTDIQHGRVCLGTKDIPAATVIWTAGTEATPVADWLGVPPEKGGQIAVDERLGIAGRDGVWVIGDAALAKDANGRKFPALAPVAKQQGRYAARAILRRAHGIPAPGRFRYWDYGMLATIGRNKAVAEFGPVHLSGFPAWLTWAGAHIFFLIGFRSRVMVLANWAFAYLTHDRGSRLIVQHGDDRVSGGREPPRVGPAHSAL